MSDTFPDETLYPVLTSLADEDRLFASNSAIGHESSQIKGSTIKGLINALKGTPPSTLNTLAKLASAINNDPAFHNTLATALAGKMTKWTYQFHGVAGAAISASAWTIHGFRSGSTLTLPLASSVETGVQVCAIVITGGGEVVITTSGSDQISTPAGLADSYTLRGNGSSIVMVCVSNIAWICVGAQDSLINAAIAPLAPLASPALTGTPTAPTAAVGTNSTQLATTAFVQAQKESPALTGTPTAPTAAVGTNTTQLATTAFCAAALAGKATNWAYQYYSTGGAITGETWKIHGFGASGTLTLPQASTVTAGAQIAAMVVSAAATVTITRSGSDQFITPTGPAESYTLAGRGSSIVLVKVTANAWAALGAPDSLINAAIAPLAPLASPALTGTPTAPTAAAGTNTTQLATTAFCAAGFLPQFSAVVETGTNVTSPSVGTLYVSTRSPGDGSTPGSATLTCTLPSPTGNGGKVIGFSCKYGTYDSWNWQYDEANWSVQGHIDGVANNTNFTQLSCRPSGVIFWCNGTTWMRVSMWKASDEHVY